MYKGKSALGNGMKKQKLEMSDRAIRDHLTNIMVYFNLSVVDIAKETAISSRTIRRFLCNDSLPATLTRLKLLSFIFCYRINEKI